MAVQFKTKWLNPLYFIINEIAEDPKVREVNIYGGKSSAKTVSICQFLSKEAYVNGASSISFRKESTIIPTTIKHSFDLAQKTMYLTPGFERLDRKYNCAVNGAELVLKGMDDAEKAKGVESYKYLYFDELNQFDQAEYEQANISLRGIPGQKIFASWNPVNDLNWVKAEYLDKHQFTDTTKYGTLPCPNSFVQISACGTIVLIKTTYEDNYWICGRPDGEHGNNNEYGYRDESLIQKYKALAKTNANSYKVNVLGEWGKTVYGGEILKNWKSEIHAGVYPYNSKLALHLIFDENVNPYFPCGMFQIGENQKDIFLVHAIALKNPYNTVKAMGREIISKLKEWGHQEAVFVGGDPTSQKEDVKQEKGHDFFRLIMAELIDYKPRRTVLTGSPSVRMSTDFWNSILECELYGLKFRADIKCRVAILDYENTKEDKNGKVDKKTIIDPTTKVSYQPWGHFCFIGETLITTNKGQVRIDKIKVGDLVLTRKGFKPVLAVHNNGIKKVETYFVGRHQITCTPDHKFFTFNKGFKEIASLLMCNDIFCIFDKQKKSICRKKLLVTTAKTLSDILTQKQEAKGFISADTSRLTGLKEKLGFMFINICARLEKYLKDIMCTTKMKIRLIMRFQTLSFYRLKNTSPTMLKNGTKKTGKRFYQTLTGLGRLQKSGTNQKQEDNGTVNSKKQFGKTDYLLKNHVSNAEKNMKQELMVFQNSVIQTAKQHPLEEKEVFDLSVDEHHEYFANNVLVSNCDLTRYFLCYVFAKEYILYQKGGIETKITVGKNVNKNSY